MNYSKAIRTVRAAKGISQKELASLAKLDSSYISRIESSERVPTIEAIESISVALGVPLYLLTLLASEQKDLKNLPEKDTTKIANKLLALLLSSQT
jgi:transcriptional regulator with XRE-family HTH domain